MPRRSPTGMRFHRNPHVQQPGTSCSLRCRTHRLRGRARPGAPLWDPEPATHGEPTRRRKHFARNDQDHARLEDTLRTTARSGLRLLHKRTNMPLLSGTNLTVRLLPTPGPVATSRRDRPRTRSIGDLLPAGFGTPRLHDRVRFFTANRAASDPIDGSPPASSDAADRPYRDTQRGQSATGSSSSATFAATRSGRRPRSIKYPAVVEVCAWPTSFATSVRSTPA